MWRAVGLIEHSHTKILKGFYLQFPPILSHLPYLHSLECKTPYFSRTLKKEESHSVVTYDYS